MQNSTKKFYTDEASIPHSTMQLITRMSRPYKGRIILFFSLTFLAVVAWTAAPLMVSGIVNELTKTHTVGVYVWWLVGAYALFRIVDETLWRLAEVLMRSFKPQMIESVRLNLFTAIHKKPYSFFVNSSSGRIGHWINQTAETTNELVDTTIWNVWGRVIGLIISALFLLTVHWSVAVVFIVWLIALFSYNVKRGKRFGDLVALQSDETSKASGLVVDSISNHISVRVFGRRESESQLLAHQQQYIVERWRNSWWQNLITNIVKGQSASIVSIIALVLVIALYGNGTIQLGGIVLFIAYFGDASSSLWQLAWALDTYYRNFGTMQNALDSLQAQDERQSSKQKRIQPTTKIALKLQNLSFFYPEQPNTLVLDRINLSVKPGEKVGIVGHSGAGKSTLVGLLLGFYEPTGGTILLNGESTLDHGPAFIRSYSSFVPQDTNLFNRSIRVNRKIKIDNI